MMRGYVKSSPYFFRRIKIALALLIVVVLTLATLLPAPLQEPANIARVPNPVKSAWFLLWIQELVSNSKYLIYGVLALIGGFVLLPWLPGKIPTEHAAWLDKERRLVNICTIIAFIVIVVLTIVAMFFRGKNWEFIVPF